MKLRATRYSYQIDCFVRLTFRQQPTMKVTRLRTMEYTGNIFLSSKHTTTCHIYNRDKCSLLNNTRFILQYEKLQLQQSEYSSFKTAIKITHGLPIYAMYFAF